MKLYKKVNAILAISMLLSTVNLPVILHAEESELGIVNEMQDETQQSDIKIEYMDINDVLGTVDEADQSITFKISGAINDLKRLGVHWLKLSGEVEKMEIVCPNGRLQLDAIEDEYRGKYYAISQSYEDYVDISNGAKLDLYMKDGSIKEYDLIIQKLEDQENVTIESMDINDVEGTVDEASQRITFGIMKGINNLHRLGLHSLKLSGEAESVQIIRNNDSIALECVEDEDRGKYYRMPWSEDGSLDISDEIKLVINMKDGSKKAYNVVIEDLEVTQNEIVDFKIDKYRGKALEATGDREYRLPDWIIEVPKDMDVTEVMPDITVNNELKEMKIGFTSSKDDEWKYVNASLVYEGGQIKYVPDEPIDFSYGVMVILVAENGSERTGCIDIKRVQAGQANVYIEDMAINGVEGIINEQEQEITFELVEGVNDLTRLNVQNFKLDCNTEEIEKVEMVCEDGLSQLIYTEGYYHSTSQGNLDISDGLKLNVYMKDGSKKEYTLKIRKMSVARNAITDFKLGTYAGQKVEGKASYCSTWVVEVPEEMEVTEIMPSITVNNQLESMGISFYSNKEKSWQYIHASLVNENGQIKYVPDQVMDFSEPVDIYLWGESGTGCDGQSKIIVKKVSTK